jgi:uncharacterized protein (TIGR02599 family)
MAPRHSRIARTERWIREAGFSLIELMVSVSVLLLLMVLIFSILDSSTLIWKKSSSKIQTFQESRAGFEAMTRKLAQATLNTYWDYDYDTNGTPSVYKRQSELHLVSGTTETLLAASSPRRPTHGIFFQAPVGFAANDYRKLNRLLNASGFFVEFGSDANERPDFLASTPVAQRWRYRLKELWQPAEVLNIFQYTSGKPKWPEADPLATPPYTAGVGNEWFKPPIVTSPPLTRTIAENVIALIVRPRLPEKEDFAGTALAPAYSYDSRKSFAYQGKDKNGAVVVSGNSKHQLPALIEIFMVTLDETSAARLAAQNGSAAPDLGLSTLFLDSSKLTADLATLEGTLRSNRLGYRIFSSTVAIEGAKWSND